MKMKWILLAMMAVSISVRAETPAEELARLRRENASLKAEVEKIKQTIASLAKSATKPSDTIAAAIKEGKLVLGMTLEEAQAACKSNFKTVETKDRIEYMFLERLPNPNPRGADGINRTTAVFEDNKIIAIYR